MDLLLFSAHVPTIYIYIFYSLVLLQIVQGCVSLWSGMGWFRMVREQPGEARLDFTRRRLR